MKANVVALCGRVKSGMGDCSKRMEQVPGLLDAYSRKTGMHLVPGTLNVELETEYVVPKGRLMRLEAGEYGGTVSVSIVPCKINSKEAFILRTDANEAGTGHHPRTIVEIASDVMLRERFALADGDEVAIEIEQ